LFIFQPFPSGYDIFDSVIKRGGVYICLTVGDPVIKRGGVYICLSVGDPAIKRGGVYMTTN
jgi:hypothetical protein